MHTPIHFVAPFLNRPKQGVFISIGFVHPTRVLQIIVALPPLRKIFLGNLRCYSVGEGYLICGSFSIVVYSNRCLGHNEHSDGSKHNHRECL